MARQRGGCGRGCSRRPLSSAHRRNRPGVGVVDRAGVPGIRRLRVPVRPGAGADRPQPWHLLGPERLDASPGLNGRFAPQAPLAGPHPIDYGGVRAAGGRLVPEDRAAADALQFHLLGSLQLVGGDRAETIGSVKQRLLLAALLVDANTVVSVDRLCHLLWDDTPPRKPEKSLHTHVSRLRDLLYGAGGASARHLIATRPPGYVLQVEPDRIDAHRFEQSLHTAQRIGDPSAALKLLDDALALWRGPALAGFRPRVRTRRATTTGRAAAGRHRRADRRVTAARSSRGGGR